MFNSFKDLYVCYPFMTIAERPDFFQHVKDIRVTATMPASNILPQYKNLDSISATLVGFGTEIIGTQAVPVAYITVVCLQYGYMHTIPVRIWSTVPATESYCLVDDAFEAPTGELLYELHPDCIYFQQKAPKLIGYPAALRCSDGTNIEATAATTGVSLYGAPGVGTGTWKTSRPAGHNGIGINSINGIIGDVTILGTGSVKVQTDRTVDTMTITLMEVTGDEP